MEKQQLTKRQLPVTKAPPAKRQRRSAEGMQNKKELDRARQKSRIYLTYAYDRWKKFMKETGQWTDADVAIKLLDCYDDHISKGPLSSIDVKLESCTSDDDSSPLTPEEWGFQTPRTPPPPPVSSICAAESLSDRVLSVSVGVTPIHWKRPHSILSSTHQEPCQPSNARLTINDDVHECDGDTVEVNAHDSTYISAQSVFTESALSQASPSINDVPKYIVDEDCLLQLFEKCPACGLMCEVQKATRGTFLAVHQLCLQCHFSRNWRSQQTEMAVPSGDPRSCTSDPESCAAAITAIIGASDGNDSSDSEVDGGDRNSDSDWDPSGSELGTDEKREKGFRKLCTECGKYFYSQKAHTCENKKPYSCNVCGKRYFFEFKLKTHSKIHKDSYKHVCKYCFSTFRTRPDKLVHEQSHPPAAKPYQCPDCPEVFAKIQERCDHLLSHRGPKRHICHICGMEFFINFSLERHMVVHTKAKQFVCEVCQRSFTQSCHLKSHMRVHTGEKPYQCQHCDKSFNHNVSLKSHIQRYHGQVPNPGMTVQIEKTSMNVSEVEKDEMSETESSVVDAEEAEQSMETLCNTENGGDDEEEKKEDQCTKKCKYYRPTGRPRGRPKKNAVITLEDANQLKRLVCIGDENEEGQGNSDSADVEQEHDSDTDFDPAGQRTKKKGGAQSRKVRGRCRGKQK